MFEMLHQGVGLVNWRRVRVLHNFFPQVPRCQVALAPASVPTNCFPCEVTKRCQKSPGYALKFLVMPLYFLSDSLATNNCNAKPLMAAK